MPIFFQHRITESARLGIWKIEESEDFFKANVPQHRDVTHPHKRLQHLAGRFLLHFLFPDFPYQLIQIADTRKPFLRGERYHFSISHCGDYAAAIVSKEDRVGIDIEIPDKKIIRIRDKFLSHDEKAKWSVGGSDPDPRTITLLWSCKEAVFKWYGDGGVDFSEQIQLKQQDNGNEIVDCFFAKNQSGLSVHYNMFDHLVLTWVVS